VETHKQDDHMESFFLAETVSISTANVAANATFDDTMLVCLQCLGVCGTCSEELRIYKTIV
jgi:hypothetical protein